MNVSVPVVELGDNDSPTSDSPHTPAPSPSPFWADTRYQKGACHEIFAFIFSPSLMNQTHLQ